MKATAKHDCKVTLTTSLNSLSLNTRTVAKGEVIELPVFLDEEHPEGVVSEVLGKRCVVFQEGPILIPTYSKDFDYED